MLIQSITRKPTYDAVDSSNFFNAKWYTSGQLPVLIASEMDIEVLWPIC